MTPGKLVRRLLGDRVFAPVVHAYRRIFVDLDAVADCIPELPEGAELLDVGGGDGALLDRILRRQPWLRASIVDREESVGLSLTGERRQRVQLFPCMDLCDFASRVASSPHAIVLSDVLHHVPASERESFLREVAALRGPALRFLVLKEVAPYGWRARLGLLSDWYVTGDPHVELMTPEQAIRLVGAAFPDLMARPTPLFECDAPNYCIVFERPVRARATSFRHAVRRS